MNPKDLLSALPKIVLVLALLAGSAVLTVQGVITANDAYGFLGLVVGATAVAGTIVLSDANQSNSNLLPHVVIVLAIMGYTVALGSSGYFSGTEIVGIFSVLIGGGSLAMGTTTSTPTAAKIVPAPILGNPPAILTPTPVPSVPVPPSNQPSTF